MFFLPLDKTFISSQQNFNLSLFKLLYLDQNVYFQTKHQLSAKPFSIFQLNLHLLAKPLPLDKINNFFKLNFYLWQNLFIYWCIGVDMTSSIIPMHWFDGIYSKFHQLDEVFLFKKIPTLPLPSFPPSQTYFSFLFYFLDCFLFSFSLIFIFFCYFFLQTQKLACTL